MFLFQIIYFISWCEITFSHYSLQIREIDYHKLYPYNPVGCGKEISKTNLNLRNGISILDCCLESNNKAEIHMTGASTNPKKLTLKKN